MSPSPFPTISVILLPLLVYPIILMVSYCSSFSSQCWHLFFCPHLHCVFSSVFCLIVFLTHIFAFFCSFPPALHYTPRNCLLGPVLRSSAVKVSSMNLTVKDLYRLYKQSRKDKTTKKKRCCCIFMQQISLTGRRQL